MSEEQRTCGLWESEASVQRWLESFLIDCKLFHVYSQLSGRMVHAAHFQTASNVVRPDVMLLPTREFIESAGWNGGAIIIDAKPPGTPIGQALAQLNDYMNSCYAMPALGGVAVAPTFAFVFSAKQYSGTTRALLAQRHIGTCTHWIVKEDRQRDKMVFYAGGVTVLTIERSGNARVQRTNFGHKVGRR